VKEEKKYCGKTEAVPGYRAWQLTI